MRSHAAVKTGMLISPFQKDSILCPFFAGLAHPAVIDNIEKKVSDQIGAEWKNRHSKHVSALTRARLRPLIVLGD